MAIAPILLDGRWTESQSVGAFQAENPTTQRKLPTEFPISSWADCDRALGAATEAFDELRRLPPPRVADFLDDYAARIEAHREEIAALAHEETALQLKPRLLEVELPRTTDQLRQAAAAAREQSWSLPTIDTQRGLRSCLAAIGPVCVFGPNNFPLAYGSVSGGDFAAAIGAGNPVIGKANTSHPGTTRRLAELAFEAVEAARLPRATVQLIYRLEHADGNRLVSDPRTAATGYTGSRAAGLQLKSAADAAGKPIYLELSSVNPVVILPGALAERGAEIVDEFLGSCLSATGQFCTNPGLLILIESPESRRFLEATAERFRQAPVGTLLSANVQRSLASNLATLRQAGAEVLAGGQPGGGAGYSHANTLLRVSGQHFVADPERLQTEAFGNVSLAVVARDAKEAAAVLDRLEGNLTGCIYSDRTGGDEALYDALAPRLRQRVGRLLNDKMPTGVAVSAAMNHGGPYPATGHSGFTAVGFPASMRRFGMLQCFDHVREPRLPAVLRDKNPTGRTWRLIDGQWSQADVPA